MTSDRAATMSEASDTNDQCPSHKWSAGGWFGGTLGSCAWMMIVSGLLVAEGQIIIAAVPLTCSFVTMMAAVVIWKYRCRMTYMSGILSLIGVISVTTLTAWLSISVFANDQSLAKLNWPASSSAMGYVLFGTPLWGLWSAFHLRGRSVPTGADLSTEDSRSQSVAP
jgi:hypothetical protein